MAKRPALWHGASSRPSHWYSAAVRVRRRTATWPTAPRAAGTDLVVALILVIVGLASSACAQWGGDPDILFPSASLRAVAETLGPLEAKAAHDLYAAYREECREIRDARLVRLAWIDHAQSLGQYPGIETALGRALEEHYSVTQVHRSLLLRAACDRLKADLQALAPDATGLIDRRDRDARRERLRRLRVSSPLGSQLVDLRRTLESIDPDATANETVAGLLEDYETALDVPLRAIDNGLMHEPIERRPLTRLISAARRDLTVSPERLAPFITYGVDRERPYVRCHELARTCLLQVLPHLDPATATAFEEEIQAHLYPELFRIAQSTEPEDLDMRREFLRARRRCALDAAKLAAIDNLERRFRSMRTKAAARLVPLLHESMSLAAREAFLTAWTLEAARREDWRDDVAQAIETRDTMEAPLKKARESWQASLAALHGDLLDAVGAERAFARLPEDEADRDQWRADESEPTEDVLPETANDTAGSRAKLDTVDGQFLPFLTDDMLEEFLAAAPGGLPAAAATAIRDRYRAYADSLVAGRSQFDERMRAVNDAAATFAASSPGANAWMRDGNDFGAYAAMATWLRDRWAEESRLASDIAALLPDDDRRRAWTKEVRSRRREHMLVRMRWENPARMTLDLIPLVEACELDDDERRTWETIRDRYELELDETCLAYQSLSLEATEGIRRNAIAPSVVDTTRRAADRAKAIDAWMRLRVSVQQLNERYLPQVAAALSPENREAFDDAWLTAAYPDVYARSPLEAAFERILSPRNAESLRSETRAATESARAQYRTEARAIRRRIVDAVAAWEAPSAGARRAAEFERRTANGEAPDAISFPNPVVALVGEQFEFETRHMQALRATLADDVASIPAAARLLLTQPGDMSPRRE
jgi:hypothetical protein